MNKDKIIKAQESLIQLLYQDPIDDMNTRMFKNPKYMSSTHKKWWKEVKNLQKKINTLNRKA
jgi:hypothetical protein